MNKFIIVAIFQYPHEAYVIKSKLESHGITVFLKDELTIQTYDLLSNAVGGIKLQIYKSDLEISLPLLKEEGLIGNNEEESQGFLDWIDERTNKVPIIKNWRVENRSIFIATMFGIIVLLIGIIMLLPNEESLRRQQKFQKEQAVRELRYHHLPHIENLIYTEPQNAIHYSKNLLQSTYPKNKDLYLMIAYGYVELDSFELASHYFKTSMYYGFRHPRGLSALAYCQVQLNNYDKAIEYLKEAIETNSDFKAQLADVYAIKNDWTNAEKHYSDYIADRERWDIYAFRNVEFQKIKKKRDSINRLMGVLN